MLTEYGLTADEAAGLADVWNRQFWETRASDCWSSSPRKTTMRCARFAYVPSRPSSCVLGCCSPNCLHEFHRTTSPPPPPRPSSSACGRCCSCSWCWRRRWRCSGRGGSWSSGWRWVWRSTFTKVESLLLLTNSGPGCAMPDMSDWMAVALFRATCEARSAGSHAPTT